MALVYSGGGRGLRGGPHGKHEAVEVPVKRLNAQGAEIEANPVSVGKYLTSSETASAHGIAPQSRAFVWDSFLEHTTQPKVLLLVTFLFAVSSWHFINKCILSWQILTTVVNHIQADFQRAIEVVVRGPLAMAWRRVLR